MHKFLPALWSLLGVVSCLSAAELSTAQAERREAFKQLLDPNARPLRALMVAGGCCHDYANQKKIISEGVAARAWVDFTIVHEGNDRTNRVSIYEKPNWWAGYDVV